MTQLISGELEHSVLRILEIYALENVVFVYVIGGSVVLFGKNRVLKLAVVNKIV